jgi:hypothetical protein
MKKDALNVEESTPYDNLIDDKGKMVSVSPPLTGFGDDDVAGRAQIKKIVGDAKFDPYFKSLKVKFTCADEVIDFQRKFCLPLTSKTKSVVYPFDTKLCGGDVASLGVLSAISGPSNWGKTNKNREWKQMPEFIQPAMPVFYSIDVKFRSEDNLNKFARILGDEFSVESLSIYFKPQNKEKNSKFRWIEPGPKTCPQNPVYIISKGRSDSMLTSRALASMDVPHYIAIEPQERGDYEAALERFGINQHVTLLNLPFSNHGNGPGRARNWCWDHSNSLDTKKHWVLDDNIYHFYRLNRNNRYRVGSGAIFRAAEDFVDRYENVPVSGFQYRHFISPQSAYPAFVKNTRIYSWTCRGIVPLL